MRSTQVATLLTCAALTALATSSAEAGEQWQNDYIIFGRATSLWRTDPRGKTTPQPVATLPDGKTATDVTALKTDAAGKVLLAEISAQWYWLAFDDSAAKLKLLPCGPGSADLAPAATHVVCANPKRGTSIIKLADGTVVTRNVPAQGARLAEENNALDVIWADKNGIWRSPVAKPKVVIKVADVAPIRDFSVSPDGTRAVGSYDAPPHGAQLFGFALDGVAARRKGIKAGIPLGWSHDNLWVLVQDGANACLMRTLGGQYKCWKGYIAGAAAPDGKWQLMFGNEAAAAEKPSKGKASKNAKGKAGKDKGKAKGKSSDKPKDKVPAAGAGSAAAPDEPLDGPDESTDDEPGADDGAPEVQGTASSTMPLGKGPHNLYRGQLEGAFTDPPALIVHDVAGATVWVPVRTPAVTSGLPAYAPTPPSKPDPKFDGDKAAPTAPAPVPAAPVPAAVPPAATPAAIPPAKPVAKPATKPTAGKAR